MTHAQLAGLDACVHCGFCLQSCPTYRATADEADSPRGRIVLMQAMAGGHLPEDDTAAHRHLDRCLGCRACEPACPSGVEYGHALEATRERLHRHRPLPFATRVLHGVIAEPLLRRTVFGAARLLRVAGARLAGSSSPGMAWGMLAATRPAPPLRASVAVDPPVPPPAWELPAEGAPKVALFRGCIMDDLFDHVHAATERVLRANGCTIVETGAQTCCGALHVHAGQRDMAFALARANLAILEDSDNDVVVAVNAAGCGALLKEYGRMFAESPERDRAERLASRVADITEILARTGPRPGVPLDLRVAYDPPCHLLHAQRIDAAPERVLAAIPGLTRVAHADAEQCCGSAGSYTFAQPEMSGAVLGAKVEALVATDPDIVVTGNPGCIMQIGAGLRAAGLSIPVVHPIELLDWSYARAGYYSG